MKIIKRFKKLIDLISFLVLCMMYAAAAAQENIAAAEWYVDRDPGYGKGQSVSLSSLPNLTFTYTAVDTLPPGLHSIYVRTKNSGGVWSQDEKWLFVRPAAAVAPPVITSAEWYLDNDPGFNRGQSVALSTLPALAFSFNQMDTLRAGLHVLAMRSRDANGAWSQDARWLFFKAEPAAAVLPVQYAEWFIGKDPGYTKATSINLGGLPTLSFTHNRLDTLATGLHVIGIRSRDGNGSWAQDARWLLAKADAPAVASPVDYAEWFLDNDPGYTKATSINLGTLPTLSFIHDRLDTLRAGLHVIGVRSRSGSGSWSMNNRWLLVRQAAALLIPHITQAEYYLDNDNGYGRGTPIEITPAQDLASVAFSTNISALSAGLHVMGLRTRDASGSWSQDERFIFSTNTPLPVTGLEIAASRNNYSVVVRWSTLTESNTKSYEVERSADGLHYQYMSTLPAYGTSSIQLEYSYVDNDPVEGINYYRVKQTDVDGKFTYSSVVSVLFSSKSNSLVIYPNPATDFIRLKPANNLSTATVSIYDMHGRHVKLANMQSISQMKLNIEGLTSGTYYVVLSDGRVKEFGKFVKE